MTDSSPDDDDALLRRLNKLKQSSVQFNTRPSVLEDAPGEDLASRFIKLKSRAKDNSASFDPEAINSDDGDKTPWNPEDDLTIEELLAELGTEDQWIVGDRDEDINAGKLLGEARKALDSSQERGHPELGALGSASENTGEGKEHKEPIEDEDEEGAVRYVARVLEELDIEKKYGKDIIGDPDGESQKTYGDELENETAFKFPSLPTSDPKQPQSAGSDTTAVSLQSLLPSAPTFTPSPLKKKTGLPTYTDAEIETWCTICNGNATVRCLGCDDDLYCRGCWKEGHTGSDAGLEEKGHRWAVYRRPGS
ncbi:MAG: hypothetical protein M1840_007909 [Geoglossum simile]|nr:MAG: hypothetical protein M1840_007909 [Geoglossum simile]